jgi:mannose-6-phosphate isomerase-like protein (cupin superfamily)
MDITRFDEAKAYQAPLHFGCHSLRLQGLEASDTGFAWVGMSHFLPGGGCEMSGTPAAKIYVVTQGEITVELADGSSHRLGVNDSCHIPAGEERAVLNETNAPASMIVVMPYPPNSEGA